MLTEQEKLKNYVSSNKKGQEYVGVLKQHQDLVLGMVNKIEEHKMVQQKARDGFLLSRIEAIEKERENQRINDYYNNIMRTQMEAQQGEKEYRRKRKVKREGKSKVVVLNEEDLRERKDEILNHKDKRVDLLKEMGLAEKAEDSKQFQPSSFKFDDESIKNRILALRKNKKQEKTFKPYQRLRGMARVIAAFFILQKYARVNSDKRKEGMVIFMKHDISLHLEITRVWVLSCVKPILLSIINDPTAKMNIAEERTDPGNIKAIRIYVRMKGIFNGLLENTTKTRAPGSIFEFFNRITRDGKFLPMEWLLPVEQRYLTFSASGKLT
eukprot:TRINITY_DN7307_c0_g1_i10.p1 TRINITY_DN7307_c0_g1~~TRINITY_DN7307_c0_g1_i10.p1  ORF type:complete len:325 (-),score=71.31 TRINITY_DN7307_c0_g1_i10:1513-2487(-)